MFQLPCFPLPNYWPVGCAAYVCAKVDVHVCPCAKRTSVKLSAGKASVRLSLSLCLSSATSFRHVPVPLLPFSPSTDAIKRVCQKSTRINPRETPSSLPLSRPTCCDADIKHREIEWEGDGESGVRTPSHPTNSP